MPAPLRAHWLQHVPFEGLGQIEPWLQARGYAISATRLFAGEPLPEPGAVDLLIIMGGPMSINDEAEHPWLAAEKRFIRAVIERGRPVLGICLGAQHIANALGAKVYPSPHKEIGWLPIESVAPDEAATFRFPPSSTVFHWHGETFDLPPGAVRLARSAGCENQAFQLGDRVIGLQFHLETTPETARALVEHCGEELLPARYVQDEATILDAEAAPYPALHQQLNALLDYLHAQVGTDGSHG